IVGAGLPDDARIVYNQGNPNAAAQWAETIKKLEAYPRDVVLHAHSWFFKLTGKYKRQQANPKQSAYIDAAGYKQFVATMKTTREKLVKEQTAGGSAPPRGGGPGRGN